MKFPTKQQSADTLKEVKKILNKLEIPFCLFLGTALGAYRDKDFCLGDVDDLDIAISDRYYYKLDKIKEAFEEFDNVNNWLADDKLCPESSFVKKWSADIKHYSKVDIFFISEINNKFAWRFYLDKTGNNNITKLFNKKYFEKFDKVVFYGTEYNIPNHIEDYLKANYGNWKIPIHRDNWNWKIDNKMQQI